MEGELFEVSLLLRGGKALGSVKVSGEEFLGFCFQEFPELGAKVFLGCLATIFLELLGVGSLGVLLAVFRFFLLAGW